MKHLPVLGTLIGAALVALSAACGGGSGSQATPAATATPGVSGAIPERPTAFEDYPTAIADYLDTAGDAALGPPCLADLLTAWHMPSGQYVPPETSTGEGRCVLGNTDADAEDEIIVSLSAESQVNGPLSAMIAVLDRTPAGYMVPYAFESLDSGKVTDVPYVILLAGDLTGEGDGDLAFAEITCGAHTCTWHVHVVTGADYRDLTPKDGLTLATADVRIEDPDGDGTKDIILHGGIIQSVGAGPQRAQTDIYAWDGTQFSLVSTRFDPSDLRYFKVRDADDAFSRGDYVEAARLYDQAINDTSLTEVGGFGSRDELTAYALFRLGLSELQLGDTAAASDAIEQAIADYPVSLDGKAALAFRNASGLNRATPGTIAAGCLAMIAFAEQNLQALEEAWYYGYANPGFDPVAFCPF